MWYYNSMSDSIIIKREVNMSFYNNDDIVQNLDEVANLVDKVDKKLEKTIVDQSIIIEQLSSTIVNLASKIGDLTEVIELSKYKNEVV